MRPRSTARAIAIATLLTATLGRSAFGQQAVLAASGATELDSATQAALARDFGQARARGLPVEALVAKVREGRIKRARPDRIRSAVAALAVRLDSARAALGTASNPSELVAGADALGAGADLAALRAVRAASGARDVAAPLGALAQLVATGVPSRRATQMILELVRRDAPPDRVLAFGVAVETDVGTGLPATEAAVFRMRQIEATLNGGDRATLSTGPVSPATGGGYTTVDRNSPPPKRRP